MVHGNFLEFQLRIVFYLEDPKCLDKNHYLASLSWYILIYITFTSGTLSPSTITLTFLISPPGRRVHFQTKVLLLSRIRTPQCSPRKAMMRFSCVCLPFLRPCLLFWGGTQIHLLLPPECGLDEIFRNLPFYILWDFLSVNFTNSRKFPAQFPLFLLSSFSFWTMIKH